MSAKTVEGGGGLAWHGWAGLAVVAAAEVLLFAGNGWAGRWFTPLVWTGYVLLADALVLGARGRSPLASNRVEFLVVCVASVAAWWLFEFYNAPRFWLTDRRLWWHYHALVENPYLRRIGYDWAFSTIFPALFLTAEFFAARLWRRPHDESPPPARAGEARTPPRALLVPLIAAGATLSLLPFLVVNEWLVPLVWTGPALFFDPLNALRGWPSVTADLWRGRWRRLAALALAGVTCGLLWEFWNYWAASRWTYTVPYLGDVKLFEMPVLGYLGYPPFAVECWAVYVFARSLLGPRPVGAGARSPEIIIDSQ
jgi:hypothetical protein